MYRFREWINERGCIAFGHRWAYEGPGPWDWDGEGHAYCKRCCDDWERNDFFRRNPWTWGDWFWKEWLPSRFARGIETS